MINVWEVVMSTTFMSAVPAPHLINSHPSNRVSLLLLSYSLFPRCGPGQGCAAAIRSRELGVRVGLCDVKMSQYQ